MTQAKYNTAEHKAQRETWTPVVEAGDAWCAEPLCLEERDGRGRWIQPGSPWDVAHDTTGTVYLGPAHARCNRSEGATRGNRMRGHAPRPQPPPARRPDALTWFD